MNVIDNYKKSKYHIKMNQEKWVEFPRVARATEGVITMGWHGLPAGFDDESLQLNVGALKRGVIGWGGYAALTLAAYNGDSDRLTYGIGTDSTGNAYATGTAAAQKAESSRFQTADDQYLNGRNIRSGHLGINWNVTALNQRLDITDQFNPAVRAKQLSKEIGNQATVAVWKHNTTDYLRDQGYSRIPIDLLIDALSKRMLVDSMLNYQENSPYGAVILGASTLGVAISMQVIRMFDQHRFNDGARARRLGLHLGFKDCIRDPLFVIARPTRAAIASGVLASNRLVRPTPLKKLV
jgi:hypothetical protein